MALIGEIQKRIWIVFVFIGIALIGFLIMDSQSGSGGMGNRPQSMEFAAIDGQEIQPVEYREALGIAQNEFLVRQQRLVDFTQGNFEIDEPTQFNLSEQAWNELLNEKLIEAHAELAPLSVTEDEWANMVYGDRPHPFLQQLKQLFPSMGLDPNQPGAMQQFVQVVSNSQQYQDFPILMQYYMDFQLRERAAKEARLQQKYVDLIQKGAYTPAWLAGRDHQMQNSRLNLEYLVLPYRDIPDEEITLTDAEVQARYQAMKGTFTKQERTGNVEYVAFDVVPTAGDSQAVRDRVLEFRGQWAEAESDSLFLSVRSQDPYAYLGAWMTQDNLYQLMVDSAKARTVFSTPVDSFTDLYREGGSYKISKVLGRRNFPDSTHLRHIFVRFANPADTVAERATIDSIYAVLQAGGASFEELAARHSQDESNARNGGDLDWINPNTPFFPVLKTFIYEKARTGQPAIVRSPIGFHIMEVLEKRNVQSHVKVGILALEIRPSRETDDAAYRQAEAFYETYGLGTEAALFDEGVAEGGYQKRITGTFRENQYAIPNLPVSRSVIDWALNEDTELGAVRLFNLPDKHIVARLRDRTEKGVPPLEAVRTQVEAELINEKKAERLTAKMEEAMASAGGDLQAVAANLGVTVSNAAGATFGANFVPQLGAEPAVLGTLFGLDMGQLSAPITGKQGVYLVKPTELQEAAPLEDPTPVRTRLTGRERNRLAMSSLLEAMKEKADIVDNHRSFNF